MKSTKTRTAEEYLLFYRKQPVPWEIELPAFERLKLKLMLENQMIRGLSLTTDGILLRLYLTLLDNDDIFPETEGLACLRAAERGDGRAEYLLGIAYRDGLLPFGKNLRNSFLYLQKAEAHRIQKAYVPLGEAYFHGWGIPPDNVQAKRCFIQDGENPLSLRYQGFLLLSDPETAEKGLSFLKMALEHGDKESAYLLGTFLSQKGKEEEAFLLFQTGCNFSDERCLYEVGRRLEHGIGTEKNPVQALAYYQRAQNNPDACYALALLLSHFNARKNKKEISDLLWKSYRHGNFEAGKMYGLLKLSSGIREEKNAAYGLLKVLAKKDSTLAFDLFLAYRKDHQTKACHHYLRQAIRANDPRALKLSESLPYYKKHPPVSPPQEKEAI
jgi:TPR repeat protein